MDSLGGPEKLVGDGGRTVQELADCIEVMLEQLTAPGQRVYSQSTNLPWAWQTLTSAMSS